MVLTDEVMKRAEDKHYLFQLDCYLSESKKIDGALLVWSDRITDSYWNYATKIDTDERSVPALVNTITKFYKAKNRKPAIYTTPFSRPNNLPELIEKASFKVDSQDAWMFYEGPKPKVELPDRFAIKKVETLKEMKVFVNIFNRSYGGASPDEPYGALPKEYGDSLLASFSQKTDNVKVINELGMLDGVPMAIGTMVCSDGFAALYNLGVSPEYRKRGFSEIMSLNRIREAMELGNGVIFLQTEKGSYNERLFAKWGFSTEFVGKGYVLK